MPLWFLLVTCLFMIAMSTWCYFMYKLVRELKYERILRVIEKMENWL
jgi:hypothetical protein